MQEQLHTYRAELVHQSAEHLGRMEDELNALEAEVAAQPDRTEVRTLERECERLSLEFPAWARREKDEYATLTQQNLHQE